MAVLNSAPIPISDPIARVKRREFRADLKTKRPERDDPLEGHLTDPWARYFDNLVLLIESTPSRVRSVSLTDQNASIAATDMTDGAFSSGLYELKYYARITQAATTSSSLTVTLDWIDGGVVVSFSGAAITGNTTSTYQSETQLVRIDPLSPVRYSTVYASVGATPMKYALYITLTEIQA